MNAVALGAPGSPSWPRSKLVREFAALSAGQIPWVQSYFTWIEAGSFRADYALQVDQLTVIMLLVVTGVGWLIHLYSIGYMADDAGYRRFFSYLNLFMFFMLTLVLAANYAVLFVGWEGVGLCSYLLIGFWFLKKTATDAGNKAFWVNRVGDFGFPAGAVSHLPPVRHARLRRRLPRRRRDARGNVGTRRAHGDRAAAARRRHRQIGADPALRLAARCHGRSHTRQRADPCRHHGRRGRLHGGALARAFHPGARWR